MQIKESSKAKGLMEKDMLKTLQRLVVSVNQGGEVPRRLLLMGIGM